MAPGWYPDPFSNAGYLRWWDGTAWGTATSLPTQFQSTPAGGQPAYAAPPLAIASWGARLGAYVIDILIVSALTLPLTLIILWPILTSFFDSVGTREPNRADITALYQQLLTVSLSVTLVTLAVSYLYVVPQTVRTGRTLGKRATGIRVRLLAEDRAPSWSVMSVRWAAMFVPAAVGGSLWLLIDCLWPLWDKPLAQALHDKVAKTIVVRR